VVQPGDLVFNRLRTWQGGFGASAHAGIVSPAYIVARPTDADARYLNYVLQSRPYLTELTRLSKWMPPSQFDILWGDLRLVEIPWRENEVQRRIADFLDDRVTRIDRIIAARREQQRLAREAHSTSLQGVFDALVERFGEGRLGFALARMEQGWSPQAEAVPAELGEWGVMRSGCVNGGVFNATDNKRLPDGLEPVRSYEIQGGDLLMSRASGSLDLIGSVAVVPDDVRDCLLLCDKVYRLTPLPGWHAEFLAPMLRVRRNRELIRLGTSGAEGMANNLPSGVVRDLMVPLAPGRQQLLTSGEVAAEAAQVEGVVGSLARSIDLLTEYKQSLITAAVTGELDVTTASSGIPR
jgi:type I restriction enzyme S subunit